MRLPVGLLLVLCAPLFAAAARKDVSVGEVALSALAGWTAAPTPRPTHPPLVTLVGDSTAGGTRPRQSRLVGFARGPERAVIYYLEYGSEREATRALAEIRGRLWGADGPSEGEPRLLRVSNLVTVIEAPTLSVTMAVSRRLAAAGAVQDGADGGGEEATSGPTELPASQPQLIDVPPAVAAAEDPALQGQVVAALGKHLSTSTSCGQKLRDKQTSEALSCYRRFQKEVDIDPAASDLARWDAASGIGMAAAMGGKMLEAREAFLRAIKPAVRLDARKLAETYFNFACAEAELGRKASALAALKGCMAAARRAGPERVLHFRQSMQSDSSLRSLRADPRLKKLLK